jgi:hypothetical protein
MYRISFVIICAVIFVSCKTEPTEINNFEASVELIKIHEWEINDPVMLPNPLEAGVLDDTTLVVIDRSLFTINHFSKSGKLLSSVGRQGPGPMEFSNITSVAINQSGEVAIADIGNALLTIINVYTHEYGMLDYSRGWGLQLQWVGEKLIITNSPFSPSPEESGNLVMRYYDLATQEKTQFYVLELDLDAKNNPDQITCTFCFVHFDRDLRFYVNPPDTSYRVFRVDPFSEEISLIRRTGPMITPYTSEERQRIVDSYESLPSLPAIPRPQIREMPRRIFNNHIDYKGRLWVSMNVRQGEPRFFDIFNSNDEYIGSLQAPGVMMSVRQFEQDKILYSSTNDMEIFKVSLYQIMN